MKSNIQDQHMAGKMLMVLFLLTFFFSASFAQDRVSIKGTVTNGQEALSGVTVRIQNSTEGTTTDDNGKFNINAPKGSMLIFSYLGFNDKTIPVNNPATVKIQLEPANRSLNDVVIVGYGTQKKTSLTSAVSTLDGDKVTDIPITNLSNGLAGRVSGVIAKQGSGEPGRDGSNIFIRGISSIGSTQPLIIVDGIPRSFSELDPNSIASFTVLKDASAIAPYGVAGANGVILVTTKRGSTGAPTLTYNGYVGFQNPTVLPDFVNSYQYALLRNAAAVNEGLPQPYSASDLQKYKDGSDPDAFPTFKNIWGDLTNKNAVLTKHDIQLSGGTEKVKYYGDLGYMSQEGMWPTTSTKRYNLTMNLDAQVTNTTKISLSLNGRVQHSHYPSISTGRIFELIGYLHPPYAPLVFSNGMYGSFAMGSIYNSGYEKNDETAIYSQLSLEQEISFIPGLKFKGTIAYDPTFTLDKVWTTPVQMASIDTSQHPYVITDGVFGQTKPSLAEQYLNSHQITYQAGITYDKVFGKSKLNILALFEAKSNSGLNLRASRTNYNLYIDEIDMGSSSSADMSTNGTSNAAKQIGLVYRVNYDYADKYLIEASGRYDGSYYFAPDKQFGFFPAVSIGWRLSEEHFIKDNVNWIDNLKIRASYGESGALAGSPFQYLSTYNVLGTTYAFDGSAVQGISEKSEPNVNITWERAKKMDVGLDGNFWNGLLNFEVDYFHERRSNMLVSPDVTVPAEYGVGLSQVNAGIMENSGFDFSISSAYTISKDLRISLGGNLTYAKNKVLQIFESPTTYNNPNRRLTGRPLGTQFGYKSLGLFQEDDFDVNGDLNKDIATQPWGPVHPGDIRYKDMNNDGKIDDNDLTVIGDPVASPRIIYGISPSVQYKGLSLDLLFQGAAKTNWYYEGSSIMPFWETMLPYVQDFDYWTPENTDAKYPRINSSPTVNNMQRSSFWMGNANYLRLKSATLAYNLPTSMVTKIGLQAIRVYVSAENILTWTSMINYDPEIGTNNSWIPNGSWGYPNQKAVGVGLNVTF